MAGVFRLFCFPYSGASASVYASWRRKLPAWIEVHPVELPGRGRRASEPLETTMVDLARRIAGELVPQLRHPFGLFGHSMGAVLAYELCCIIAARHRLDPSILFASGTSAPSRRDDARFGALQSDEDLVAELRRLNGTPPGVLDSPDFMQMLLPVLRADFGICSRYAYQPRPKLSCPIQVVIGRDDATSEPERAQAWSEHTSGPFSLVQFPGDHFFIHGSERALLQLIQTRVASFMLPWQQAGDGARTVETNHVGSRRPLD